MFLKRLLDKLCFMLKKPKLLITGVGGYIGSVAAYLFLQQGYPVIGIDNFSTGFRQPVDFLLKRFKGRFRFYQVDLKDRLEFLFNKEKGIDLVIHYAAACLVDESMKKPEKYFSNNVCGSQNLLKQLLQNGIKKFVFSSTCAVYGQGKYVPVDEAHPANPNNPYGQSKRMIEEMIEWYGKLKGLNYVILRYFNVCGASDDGLIGDSKKPSTLLVQNAVRGAMGIEPFYFTYQEVETADRSPIRDYINVVDLNRAHLKAVDYLLRGGPSEIINLGTGKGNSVLEIVKKVEEITGKTIDKKRGRFRKGEAAKMIASIEKAKKILNWAPKHSLEDSVKSLINWYSKHPYGWDY